MNKYMIKPIFERIKEKRTALRPVRPAAVEYETDMDGNVNVFIIDRKGNVLFDKYGLTKRGRNAIRGD